MINIGVVLSLDIALSDGLYRWIYYNHMLYTTPWLIVIPYNVIQYIIE